MPMATEFDRVERYNEELLSIKSQGPLVTWYCEVSLKTRLFYLYYHKAYDHQTWQGGDLL